MHQICELWNEYDKDFPTDCAGFSKLKKVPKMLSGTAAFPVSCGVFRKTHDDTPRHFPTAGVMFVGNNPDSERNYKERQKHGISNGDSEHRMLFWRRVECLLKMANTPEVMLRESECFFTNVYPALIDEQAKNGRFSPTDSFAEWCLKFLRRQICIMVPRLVVVLGKPAREFVGLSYKEKSILGNTHLSCAAMAYIANTRIISLDHPSCRTRDLIKNNARLLKEGLSNCV